MTDEEMLINLIRKQPDPAKAIEVATKIITDYLQQRTESSNISTLSDN